jgi:RNA-directed DNA polymerase
VVSLVAAFSELLGFAFWVGPGRRIRVRVSPKAKKVMMDRVRQLTRRSRGRSLEQVAQDLRAYLLGWKGYFRLADTPQVFRDLDKWIRHRLRALQLKHWKRGRTIFRELRSRGMTVGSAAKVAANGRG